MQKEKMTIELPIQMKQEVDRLSASIGQPHSWVVEQAIEAFFLHDEWQIAEIKQALKEADAGDFATQEEIDALNAKYQL